MHARLYAFLPAAPASYPDTSPMSDDKPEAKSTI